MEFSLPEFPTAAGAQAAFVAVCLLLLVGDGPARAALQAQCPRAVFAGMRSGDDLAAHYASADAFIFPSLTETFGNVTPEAMASGLPVLAFAHGALGLNGTPLAVVVMMAALPAGLAGPARVSVGGVRDYVLGATLLNGRAECLSFGGQVMKNVAGYDVSRVLAGSMGILGVICEVSLKVLPRPPASLTLRFESPEVGGVKLAKTYTFQRGEYPVAVKHVVKNNGAAPISPQLYLQLARDGNPPAGESSFYSTFTGPAIYTTTNKFQKIEFKAIEKGSAEHDKAADNGWVSVVQHYFASAWLLPDKAQRASRLACKTWPPCVTSSMPRPTWSSDSVSQCARPCGG